MLNKNVNSVLSKKIINEYEKLRKEDTIKKIALTIGLIIVLILTSTVSAMKPGGKRYSIEITSDIGKFAEIVRMNREKGTKQETDLYNLYSRKYEGIELNKSIPVNIYVSYSPYGKGKFNDDDIIEVELSMDGGIIEKDHFSFAANDPDYIFRGYSKILYTSVMFSEQGIYELKISAQLKLKTDDPELKKHNYTDKIYIFFAFTEYGRKISSSKEEIEKYVEDEARRARKHREAVERKEKDKEKVLMYRNDVPHIIKRIIEFEQADDVVKDTLKEHNIDYEIEDGKFLFRKSQELRLIRETNLKYKVVGRKYEEITEEEKLRYNEELKSLGNKAKVETGRGDKNFEQNNKEKGIIVKPKAVDRIKMIKKT